MANSIAFAQKFTSELDKMVTQKAVTGIFADNAMNAKYNGAKTVNIPTMQMVGMGNYSESTGFPSGDTTVAFTAFTMAMDRARSLAIDRLVAEQTGIKNIAGQMAGEYARNYIIPEIDAYVLSKLAQHSTTKSQNLSSGDVTKPYAGLVSLLGEAQDALDYDEEFVYFVNKTIWTALKNSTEMSRHIGVDNFKRGDVSFKINTLDGVPVIPVTSSRMKNSFTFDTGTSTSSGGFKPTVADTTVTPNIAAAKDLNAIIVPKKGVMLCRHLEKVKIFNPDEYQSKDSWVIQFRQYYDAFVRGSYSKGIRAWIAS